MMAFWRQWAAKLDELTLRERGLAFVLAAGLVVALVYATALQPLLREQRGYLERVKLDQGQLKSINDELVKSAREASQDPHAAKRARMAKLEAGVAIAERRLAQRRDAEQLSSEQLVRLLQDVLGRNRNLRVLALRVLPGTSLAQPAAPAGAQPPSASKPPAGQFYRHGVEVEMTGTYLELLKYLEDVEALPWRLAWTSVELRTTTYPQVQLRASLYTVSPSPTLLTF